MSLSRRLLPLPLSVALLAAAACGPKNRAGPPAAEIEFHNESSEYANVYIVRAGQSVRVGAVMSGQTQTLRVPAHLTAGDGTVEVVARMLANRRQPRSGLFTLREGQRVAVTLGSGLLGLSVLPIPDRDP